MQGINLFDIIPKDLIFRKTFVPKKDNNVVELEGVVTECLPDTKFKIEVEVEGQKLELLGYLSGRMRMHYIRILEGDRVTVEVSKYDPTKGRITYRHK